MTTDMAAITPMTLDQSRPVLEEARRLFDEIEHKAILFSAVLRRLQNGEAHLAAGFKTFSQYAEHSFPGLNGSTAKQMSRQGQVLLDLAAMGRVNLTEPSGGGPLPLTTGLRALGVVESREGVETMVSVYDAATATGQPINREVVESVAPPILDSEPLELGAGSEGNAGIETEPMTEEDDVIEMHAEIHDRLGMIHDTLYDVASSLDDGADPDKITLKPLLEEIGELASELGGEYDESWISRGRGEK